MSKQEQVNEVEVIKAKSRNLRGTLLESLSNPLTGALNEDDTQIIKFHGSYQQDARELRTERKKQKLETAYSFMIRTRLPAGVCTSAQWLQMDKLADQYGDKTLRLTTRQAFQLYGIIKRELKSTMQGINECLIDTIGGCGDVNRNIMCSPNPVQSELHAEVYEWSKKISEHLMPRSRAYHEIWLDGEKIESTDGPVEPIYGDTYLPRKFKIGVVVPPTNDVDVFIQDIGLIAILEDNKLKGFNVSIGGGLGTTHGDKETHPRLGDVIGMCKSEEVVKVCEAILTTQRDYGNRVVRKRARFKYTVEDHGVEFIKNQIEERSGIKFADAAEFNFTHRGDEFGWLKGFDGKWNFMMFIPQGRVKDDENFKLKTALAEVAKIHTGDFRLTANQNLVIAGVEESNKAAIDAVIEKFGLVDGEKITPLRQNSMACVALPTCSLAMAEAERELPDLVETVENILQKHGLPKQAIVMRMTGCPNGCGRPFVAEIALVGKALGRYNLHLGGDVEGFRLNKMYKENITTKEIHQEIDQLIGRYAKERNGEQESFGDFVIRAGIVDELKAGRDFHG